MTVRRGTQTPLVELAFNRDDEFAADIHGIRLASAAGYSPQRALKAIHTMLDAGLEYSSIEALKADHPSWKDRLVQLTQNNST